MTNEIEIKFEIDHSTIEPISHFFNSLTILKQETYQLENIYYDTHDNFLKSHHTSIRVRGIQTPQQANKQYELTLKTSGKSIAGLHQRLEYNADLPSQEPDLTLLPPQLLPDKVDLAWLSTHLVSQFTTNFDRAIWLVQFKQSEIEIALDCGSIALANRKHVPIKEIELELKTGNQADLILLALQLCQFNVHLFSQSKAARGYYLLKELAIKKIDCLTIQPPYGKKALAEILHFWQSNEEYALANNDFNYYQQTLMQVKSNLTDMLAELMAHNGNIRLDEIFNCWSNQLNSLKEIKSFAFSEKNTQLKLLLLSSLLSLSD